MATSYRFGEFELDTAAGELRHRDERVPLEPKVFDLLMHLLRHRDRIVSVPELLTAVWTDISVERGSVHRAVRLLRRALSDQATQLEAIVTVPRRGYRFAQDVKEIANRSASRAGPTFVGREEICGELDARLERAISGSQTGLALLHGPAGIGKSATLARLRRSAERLGATVFEGRCIEGPAAPPYRPWSRILRASLRLDGATDLAAGLETGLHDVAQALPEIGAALGVRIQAKEVIDPGAQHRVHAAIASWIRLRCRRSPLVLLIDDLHRADLDSIQLLAFLIQDLTDEPLLLATAFRDRPEQISNPAAVEALITLRPDAPIRLAEFSQSEVEEFARERSDETWTSSELDRLWLASGGNPLFVEQLVRTHGADRRSPPLGPPAAGLRGALRRLLEDASLPCSEMLSMASVFGRVFEPAVLAAGLGRSMIEIQTAIDEAVQLRLLEPDEDPEYRFVHGLFPEVLYADLSSTVRIEQHGRALSGLIAMQAGPRHRLTELAHHAHEAASRIGIRRAFDYAIAAANDAAKRLAFENAIQLFKRALEMKDPRAGEEVDRAARANCLINIATLLVMRGAAAAARPFFDDAAELARELDDSKLFAMAALGPAAGGEFNQLVREEVPILMEAVKRLGEAEPALRVRLLCAIASSGYYGDRASNESAAASALAIARSLGEPELICLAAISSAEAQAWTSRSTERGLLVEEANVLARRHSFSPLTHGLALRYGAYHRIASGDRLGYERYLGELEWLAKQSRVAYFDWRACTMHGTIALLEGRYDDARSLIQRQLEISRQYNPAIPFEVAAVQTTVIDVAVGSLQSVQENMQAFVDRFPDLCAWRTALALAMSESGRLEAASDQLARVFAIDFEPRHNDILPLALALSVETIQILGDQVLAARLADQLDEREDVYITVGTGVATYGATDRYRGLCAEVVGEFDRAAALIEKGLALDDKMGARPFVARGSNDLARVLSKRGRAGDKPIARALRERAFALASELGMPRLTTRIRS